jgi:hypothetical protein
MCHDDAAGDKISDINGTPKVISQSPAPKISIFNKTNATGSTLVITADPFEVFWTKGTTKITPGNRSTTSNMLAVGDDVSITVKPPASMGTTFPKDTQVVLTLIYVRTNYEHFFVDVTKMFSVTSNPGSTGVTTEHRNPDNPVPPGGQKPDTWILTVVDAAPAAQPSEVKLNLKCLDLKGTNSSYLLWLRVEIATTKFDFVNSGSIILK